jgi:hypothetical protein
MRVNIQHVVKWNFKANLSFIAFYALNFSLYFLIRILNCFKLFLVPWIDKFNIHMYGNCFKKLQHNIKINYRDRDGTKGWTLLSLLHLFLFVKRFFYIFLCSCVLLSTNNFFFFLTCFFVDSFFICFLISILFLCMSLFLSWMSGCWNWDVKAILQRK